MKILRDNILAGFIILMLLTFVAAIDCPEDCTCDIVEDGEKPLKHAKCTSLNGLSGDMKTIPIHSLDLSHANLDRVSHFLEKLKDLESLDLSNNNLSEIARLGKRIKTLNISHNKITSGKLTKIPGHVQNLDLSFNEITYLPLEITKLKHLKSIHLNGNSINCTCETLEVRNWVQHTNVWTDNIACTYPAEVKGHSWLQVKQSELCEKEDSSSKQDVHNLHKDSENYLMLGDGPAFNEGSGDDEADELGKTFLIVPNHNGHQMERMMMQDEGEGSGDDHASRSIAWNDTQEDEDGSGSGIGPIINFALHDRLIISTTPFVGNSEELETDVSSTLAVTFRNDTTTESIPDEVTDEIIVPVVVQQAAAAPPALPPTEPPQIVEEEEVQDQDEEDQDEEGDITDSTDDAVDSVNADIKVGEDNESALREAGADNNNSTYILLGIVLAILVVLVIFVACKRSKAKRRNRALDLEGQRATELQDMDKKNLGKPVHKNGNAEHAPLIEDRNKADMAKPINGNKKVPYVPHDQDGNAQQPLLTGKDQPDSLDHKKIPNAQQESNNNVPRQTEPNGTANQEVPRPAARPSLDKASPEPRKGAYPPPKSPRTKKPSTGDGEATSPSSPKASRYSPVYSPETGRVKIKLTETPKPKTPLLVTRSKSNAGEIITTPSENQSMPASQ